MDKDYFNMNNYSSPSYFNKDTVLDINNQHSIDNSIFNPFMQYEQAYMYYRYLSQQMEYKIRCKEYERLSSNSENSRNNLQK